MAEAGETRLWRYVAETGDGRVVRGELSGASEQDVLRQMRQLGVTPVDLAPAGPRFFGLLSERATLNRNEQELFVRGLADLLSAGISISEAIGNLARGERRRVLRRFLERVHARVQSGDSLSAALAGDPAQSSRLLAGLVRAGEETGALAAVLERYAGELEAENEMRRTLAGHLVYPVALLCLMALTLVFLAYIVLPQFEGIFDASGSPPPPETAFVLAVGAFLRAYAIWIPPGVVLILMGLQGLLRLYGEQIELWLVRVPMIGRLRQQSLTAHYFSALGFLLGAGAPLARAEGVARATVENAAARSVLDRAGEALRSGQSLSDVLERTHLFADDALRLVVLGEKSGELAAMLSRAGQLARRSRDQAYKRLLDLISPVLIAVLGGAVGGVIAAVMSGVLSLNDAIY